MAGPRHPVCGHTQGTAVKDGTSALHAAPTAGPYGRTSDRRIYLKTMVFDGEMLHRLFRSTAYSIALARHIKIKPMQSEPNDPVGVKVFIAILPNRYLTKEIDLPNASVLEKEADDGANEFGNLFWQELDERGARGGVAFLKDVEAQRENALAKVAKTYREAADYNQGADKSQETLRHTLITVKCVSTIVVAGITLPFVSAATGAAAVGSAAAFGVGTAYSIGLELIKDWDTADSSQLVLVARDTAGTEAGKELTQKGSEFMQEIYAAESQGIKKAEKTLAGHHWLEKRIAAATDASERARLLRRLGRAKVGAQEVKNTARLATALKAVPYLFFAWSAKDALVDAYHEW